MMEIIILIVGFILLPLLVAFLICSKFESDMRTAVLQHEAGQYVDSKELSLKNKQDIFTHTTESRVKIQKDK